MTPAAAKPDTDLPPLLQRAMKGMRFRRSLIGLSTLDVHALCMLAVAQHDLLRDIRTACDVATEQGCVITPQSLRDAIANGLAEISATPIGTSNATSNESPTS